MNRRFFLRGLVAAPAVVAVGSLMPLRGLILRPPVLLAGWSVLDPENTATMGTWVKTSRTGKFDVNLYGWLGSVEVTEADTWQYLTSPASRVLYAEAEL